ncbi:hypothetical protein KCP71_11645 [Salmonella enterica subsp. enterica]|nr:hypothetical protein KCP71_11645 [Salmonella enterica subsp. enterica]
MVAAPVALLRWRGEHNTAATGFPVTAGLSRRVFTSQQWFSKEKIVSAFRRETRITA